MVLRATIEAFGTQRERSRSTHAMTSFDLNADESSCLHTLFEQQVRRTPHAVALRLGAEELTYNELNLRSNRLAHDLVGRGVVADTLVGIRLGCSFNLVIGILAILKAGGAYLPFDPGCPTERLALMIEDSGIKVLLTDRELMKELPRHQLGIVCMEEVLMTPSGNDNPGIGSCPDQLAYSIYTSGSTGKPKGVLVSHRNVVRLFTSTQHWFGFTNQDVWTLFHSYAFDFSVWELWGALLYGGQLVLVPYLVSRSPQAFFDLVCREEVTVLNQTPSAFQQFMTVDSEVSTKRSALRYVIFGGEALSFQSLKGWFERHGDQKPRLINMYGITETTVHVSYRPVSAEDLSDDRGSLIGVPIPDLQLYVLDPQKNETAVGEEGELYVGGAGVARGYLKRPKLTAERFVEDPFIKGAGKLYRTGDLARRLPDGDLQYLGRIDDQVKIRGFRIELGEIESAVKSHSAIRNTVVLAHEHAAGKRLVAYIITKSSIQLAELRSFLRQRLPDYMVPSAFILIETIPLTSNGKVDRNALREKANNQLQGGRGEVIAPRDDVEEELRTIWEKMLGVQEIGIRDSFFDLGGHSVLAARLLAQIEKQFNKRLSLNELFHFPTIEKIALLLKEGDVTVPHSPVIPMRSNPHQAPFFCIPGAGDTVLRFRDLVRRMTGEAFYGLQPKTFEESRNENRLEDIASNYLVNIREIQPQGPYYLGGFCFGALVAYEMAQQLQAAGERVALLAMLEPMTDMFPVSYLGTQRDRCLFHLSKLLTPEITTHLATSARNFNARILSRILPNERTQIGDKARALAGTYTVKPYAGRTALFIATDTFQSLQPSQDPRMEWSKCVMGGAEVFHIPGDHVTIIHEPNVPILANDLLECLRTAREGVGMAVEPTALQSNQARAV